MANIDGAASQVVLRSDADGVCTLTLNRPGKLNALSPQVFQALRSHLRHLEGDETVRCVVLAGAGRAFSAGHDLASLADEDADERFAAETIDHLERLAQPTIAKIHGYCLTGGLELALGCDLLVAGRSAQLADTHSALGLVPVWGMSVRLPERVGLATAKLLMFTGRRIDAMTAAQMGLVDLCADDEQLNAVTDALAQEICRCSASANGLLKSLLLANAEQTRAEALAFERSEPFGRPADMDERLARGAG